MRKNAQKLSLSRETLLALELPSLQRANAGWPITYTTVSADSCAASCGASYCLRCRQLPTSTTPTGCCFPDTVDMC